MGLSCVHQPHILQVSNNGFTYLECFSSCTTPIEQHLDAMEMDGGMKKSQYFHSSFPCWSEGNLLFHESFVVMACIGRCQGL